MDVLSPPYYTPVNRSFRRKAAVKVPLKNRNETYRAASRNESVMPKSFLLATITDTTIPMPTMMPPLSVSKQEHIKEARYKS